MAQVNIDVAKESSIQSINDTITNNVADKQTLTTVSNKIGNFTEGGSLETLVASLSQQVGSLQTELADVKSKVESSNNQSSSGAIKSVQRGTTTGTSITISSVDPNKCIVILDNQYPAGAAPWVYGIGDYSSADVKSSFPSVPTGAYVTSLTATKLTITNNKVASNCRYDTFNGYIWTYSTGTVAWQVIEFY